MTCRACGGALHTIFAMDPMPLAGAFCDTPEEAEALPRYPLEWRWCERCGLVNVWPDIPDETLYRHYAYAASTVPALVRHHTAYAEFLSGRTPYRARLLEIGCNDGVLLNRLPRSWMLCGIDPSDTARQAHDALPYGPDDLRRYELWDDPFTGEEFDDGTFDIVTSSNAFAHFSGLDDAIGGIARILHRDGTAYIEVHDLHATLASGQWDTIYHEHKVEWSLGSLTRAFARHGLVLVESWSLPLHGGLIRAAFRHGDPPLIADPEPPDTHRLSAAYANRRGSRAYQRMLAGGVAYGAAARASVYLNQCPDLPLDYVVDGSPRRAGKYLPGLGLPIVAPEVFDEDAPRRALITAWNHADDIRARHPDYRGEWVTAW